MSVFGVILVRIFLHSDWIFRIQSKCGKIQTRITTNRDTFNAVTLIEIIEFQAKFEHAMVSYIHHSKLPFINFKDDTNKIFFRFHSKKYSFEFTFYIRKKSLNNKKNKSKELLYTNKPSVPTIQVFAYCISKIFPIPLHLPLSLLLLL